MRGGSNFVHEHQFMLAAVERSHAAVGLVPDAQILEFGEHLPTRRQELF